MSGTFSQPARSELPLRLLISIRFGYGEGWTAPFPALLHKLVDESQQLLMQARHTLRAWTSAIIRFDEHVQPLQYVIAPDGRLVAPAMVAMLSTLDTALHIPDEDPDGLQLLVELHEFDADGPEGALADRWRIYHGTPDDIRWAVMDVDLARFRGGTIDGEAMVVANPLAECEPRICALINASHVASIQQTLESQLSIKAQNPLVVGVHPDGLDVRCDHDVVQLPLTIPLEHDQAAGAVLAAIGVV